MRCFDRLAEVVCSFLPCLVVSWVVSTVQQAMHTCEAHFERRSSTMRSSEDDACCDMVSASPEAPNRGGDFDGK